MSLFSAAGTNASSKKEMIDYWKAREIFSKKKNLVKIPEKCLAQTPSESLRLMVRDWSITFLQIIKTSGATSSNDGTRKTSLADSLIVQDFIKHRLVGIVVVPLRKNSSKILNSIESEFKFDPNPNSIRTWFALTFQSFYRHDSERVICIWIVKK